MLNFRDSSNFSDLSMSSYFSRIFVIFRVSQVFQTSRTFEAAALAPLGGSEGSGAPLPVRRFYLYPRNPDIKCFFISFDIEEVLNIIGLKDIDITSDFCVFLRHGRECP